MRCLFFLFLLSTFSLYGVDSWEADPESLIEQVSVIYGDYSEGVVDMVVLAPDPLVVSRFYSSRDMGGNLGGWRFFPEAWLTLERGPEGEIAIEVGNRDGASLTYRGKTKLTPDLLGYANNAKGSLLPWSDLANNSAVYNPRSDQIEIQLCSNGKRFYRRIPGDKGYRMAHETLPSGNKLFYTFDPEGRLVEIRETNSGEKKTLAWVRLEYREGEVSVEGSDGQRVDYFIEAKRLSRVVRSNHPEISYSYRGALLVERELPEGAVTQIEYDSDCRVKRVVGPEGEERSFSYGKGATEVLGAQGRKELYRFDEGGNLTAIEHHLEGRLYRLFRKEWEGRRLVKATLEDGGAHPLYCKCYTYQGGKLSKTEEFGPLTGIAEGPISEEEMFYPRTEITEETLSDEEALTEVLTKLYTYHPNGYTESDAQGCGVKYLFVPDTCRLMECSILWSENAVSRRYLYRYNEDAVLVGITLVSDSNDKPHLLSIVPKVEMPNLGAPESAEWSCNQLLQRTVYKFDRFGNIVAGLVYGPDGSCHYSFAREYEGGLLCSETNSKGEKSSYEYDRGHRLISVNGEQFRTLYSYDRSGQIRSKETQSADGISRASFFTYDKAGQLLSAISPEGEERFSYDALGRQVAVARPEGEFHYRYDLFDHLVEIEDPSGQLLKSSYTMNGQPTLLEYPDGTKEIFRYNLMGRLDLHRDRKGFYRQFTYDALGRVKLISHFDRWQYDKGDRQFFYNTSCQSQYIPPGIFVNYDELERIQSVSKSREKSELNYDSLGRLSTIKRWISRDSFLLEKRAYDASGHLVEERTEDHLGKLFLKRRYEYDHFGRLFRLIGYPNNEESLLAEYEYDGWGRLTGVVDSQGYRSRIEHGSWLDQKWVGPDGHQVERHCDSAGRPVEYRRYSPEGQLLDDWRRSYDSFGLLIEESSGGYQRKYERLKGAVTTPEGSFIYNEYGDLVEKKSGNEFVKFKYNHSGLCSALLFSEGGKEERIALHFNEKGRLERVERPSCWKVAYDYISEGDLVGLEKVEDEWGSYQVEVERDRLGRVSLLKLPDGSAISYAYEGPFVSQVTRILDGEERYAHTFVKRDWMGHLLEERLPGALGSKIFSWNSAGQCLAVESDFLKDRAFEGYDSFGNLHARERLIGSWSEDYGYQYDGLSQLVREKGLSYGYDSLGNRLNKGEELYRYDGSNHLLSAGETAFTYHSNGCLASKKKGEDGWFWGADRWSFGTNGLGQVTEFERGRFSESYHYDLGGRRLSRKGTKVQRYFYLGEMELGSLNESGYITQLKVPSDPNLPDSRAIAIELESEVYVPIYDLDGSVGCLVDLESREVVESYAYTAFGEEVIRNRSGSLIATSFVGNPWRYRGKRVDEESGLIWFGYRYYDSAIGRWLTRDPLGTVDSLNLYLYAHNNPIKYIDRMGLEVEINPECPCIHGHPGYYHRTVPGCGCICGIEEGRRFTANGDLISTEQLFSDYSPVMGRELVFANSPIAPWLTSFDGLMQAAFGMIEASLGGALTFTPMAPLGWVLMTHGLDQSLAGVRLLWAGERQSTLTSQILQKGGLSSHHADLVDSGISIFGTAGGAGALRIGAIPKIVSIQPINPVIDAKFSRAPKSLMDRLVLEAAQKGAGKKVPIELSDPRFKGMEKFGYVEKSAAGMTSEVHYVRNPTTGELLDFKFKHHAE